MNEEQVTQMVETTAKAGVSEVTLIGFAVIGLGTVIYGAGVGCKKLFNKIKINAKQKDAAFEVVDGSEEN